MNRLFLCPGLSTFLLRISSLVLENCPPSALFGTPNKPRVSRGSLGDLFNHRKCHSRELDSGQPSEGCASALRAPGLEAGAGRGVVAPGGSEGGVSPAAPTGTGRSRPLGSQHFAGPKAGCLERGAEDRVGSPRLRSPRPNPFGFCFCFANPGRGPNLLALARTH